MARWLRWSWSSCWLWDSPRSVMPLKKGGEGGEGLERQTLGISPAQILAAPHAHQAGGGGVRKAATSLAHPSRSGGRLRPRDQACPDLGREVPALSTWDMELSLVFPWLAFLPCSA